MQYYLLRHLDQPYTASSDVWLNYLRICQRWIYTVRIDPTLTVVTGYDSSKGFGDRLQIGELKISTRQTN